MDSVLAWLPFPIFLDNSAHMMTSYFSVLAKHSKIILIVVVAIVCKYPDSVQGKITFPLKNYPPPAAQCLQWWCWCPRMSPVLTIFEAIVNWLVDCVRAGRPLSHSRPPGCGAGESVGARHRLCPVVSVSAGRPGPRSSSPASRQFRSQSDYVIILTSPHLTSPYWANHQHVILTWSPLQVSQHHHQ